MSPRTRLALLVGMAAVLRLARAAARWEEWAWRYSAYPGPTADALAAGDLSTALTHWTGLHPPMWSLLHAASELLLPVPALWLLAGAALGTAGVALVARRRPRAGLLLAVSPVALHYTAEVNDYPLLFCLVCVIWTLRDEVEADRRHWSWLALAGAAAGWTHALGGLVATVAVLTLHRRLAARSLGLMLLAWVPLVPGAIAVLTEGGATAQPPFKPELVLRDLVTRFGPGALLLGPVAWYGIRQARAEAMGLLVPAIALVGLVSAGIAAPHQFPYLLVLVVPGAVLAAAGGGRGPRRWVLLFVAAAHSLWAGTRVVADLKALVSGPSDRAIDVALRSEAPGWTCAPDAPATRACAGEALVLISGGGGNDDDKRRISPVLWRLRPWQRMPRLTGLPGAWEDHRRGHPRVVQGRAVYVFDHVRPQLADVLDLHPSASLVLYGDGPRQRFLDELEQITGHRPPPRGPDHLLHLPLWP